MTTLYINELAKRAFDSIKPEEWEKSERISRYLAKRPDSALELELELESHVLLQAEVAWHIGYTPSKWLLENELVEIQKRRDAQQIGRLENGAPETTSNASQDKNPDAYTRAADLRLMGLCLSGGGIRSATFNLGILQGLAEQNLLSCFDYLSSVSGGGYIHQWLAAWGKRKTFDEVQQKLIPLPDKNSPQSHPEPIRWLRRYSNYLTPEKGLFTADTWVTVATWLRNTLLNQIILISGLLFLIMLPHLFTFSWFVPSRHWSVIATIAAIVYFFLVAAAVVGRELSRLQGSLDVHNRSLGQSGVQALVVLPLLLVALLVTLLFPNGAFGLDYIWSWFLIPFLFAVLTLTVTFGGGTLTSYLKTHHFIAATETAAEFFWKREWCFAHVRASIAAILLFLAAVIVALGGAMWHVVMSVMIAWFPSSSAGRLWRLELVIAPPLLLLGPLLTVLFLIGLIGRTFKDSRREWLARVGAWGGLYILIWLLFAGGSLFGLVIFKWLACKLWAGIPALVGWIGTSLLSVIAGQSSKTGGARDDKAPSKFNVLEIVAKVGPYVFVAGLLILLSALAEGIIRGHGAGYLLMVQGAAAVTCAIFAWRVDINEFSMHAYYRDRLARCYLGASNANRKANPFTGFDEEDSNIAVSSLSASDQYFGPYPIFCTTLNLTFGEELAWQERKGASFAFTPLFSGYDVSWTAAKGRRKDLRFNGFADTATYAYPYPGIHISTAAAISGAAISPNCGYHSNPAIAFLLTVFNVRLGWWLRNPRTVAQDGTRLDDGANTRRHRVGFFHDPYPTPSPHSSLLSLTNELLGRTNDTSKYLYLTDGGHFDNMGLYELVRRRCRFIVICDAEEDGQLTFEGIGMAIRKCRIDFGAEVSLDLRPLQHLDGGNSSAHCVVGTIRYPEDRGKKEEDLGIVVYVKSSLTGDEPADVLNYKKEDSCFPHDSTLNQWFTESQFESYRRLGHHVAKVIFNAASPTDLPCTDIDQRVAYFRNLRKIWSAFTPEMQQYSAEHSKTYAELLQKIRADAELPGFFDMLFDRSLGDKQWTERKSGQFDHAVQMSSQLIEFMFIVYLQLKLVYPDNLNHPFAQGWLDIFKSWARIDVIQAGWKKYGTGYTQGFQIFAKKEIELR